MTFKKGESGNIAGRPKGILNKRTQLCKLLDSHAEALVAKMVELALGGDVQALRLCIERVIPKRNYTPIEIELPEEINRTNLEEVKGMILRAVFEGRINPAEAENLFVLVNEQCKTIPAPIPSIPSDPIEAARVYQRFIQES